VFLSFQWDILLLETGFVAIFMAPFAMRSRFLADRHPPRLAIWLVWWLLFRLMFESGAVKLTWNAWQKGPDGLPLANTWESLTALNFHYWTQPLPVWTSWYAAKLPSWFQKLSVLFVFVVELGLPWLIIGPRLLRCVAFGGITLLMLLIAGTGNYNFFNLLTVILALLLLDDKIWPRFLQRRIRGIDWPVLASPTRWRSFLLIPFAGLAIVLGTVQVKESIVPTAEPGPSLESKLNIGQFCLVNSYGLFRQMTETRPEILIEGSADGTDWKMYEFRWKPGDLSLSPRFVAPHQPRLDWQMWFEALRLEQVHKITGTIEPRYMSPWFQSFLMQLLRGEPKVVGLLEANPFPNATPRFMRIALYQYRFTDALERQKSGNWWNREQVWVGPNWSLAQ
jgi:lipase maturation factor 1